MKVATEHEAAMDAEFVELTSLAKAEAAAKDEALAAAAAAQQAASVAEASVAELAAAVGSLLRSYPAYANERNVYAN